MSNGLMDILVIIGVQHLWQSAFLLLLAWFAFKLQPSSADARSWIWLCIFVLAVVSPLAVFLPGDDAASATLPAMDAVKVSLGSVVGASSSVAADHSIFDGISSVLKPIAMLAWLLGFAWGLCRLWLGWFRARRLRDTARTTPYLERLLAHELPGNAEVRISNRIASPMVVGLAHPCVLVPRKLVTELPEPVLQNILHHEIAHIRRHDLWLSLAQATLTAFYWWNPFLRLIGTRLDLAREMACDERAALQSGGGRVYAKSLLTSADKLLSFDHPRQLLAVGIFGTRKSLTQRIEELLNMETRKSESGYKPAMILGTVVLLASASLTLAATPRLGGAQSSTTTSSIKTSGKAALLVEAAGAGQLDEVNRLVRSGVSVDASVDGDGTALIAAARTGDQRMITALLRMGADVNQASRGDGNPLIMAAMAGHQDVVAQLVASGANVNAIVPDDETALINAAREGYLPIVEYLVEHGADVNLGVRADFLRWRSPLNQARDERVRDYLIRHGAVAGGP